MGTMVKRKALTSILLLLLFVTTSWASDSPMVSVQWLAKQQSNPNLVMLEFQPEAYYAKAHIPGSVHSDYNNWRMTDANGLGKMLPARDKLEKMIGELGIDNQSQVVIVPTGQGAGDMAAAARIYWTLYVAGLDNIKIMEGGLLGWYDAFGDARLGEGYLIPEAKTFTAKLRAEQILTMEKVGQHLRDNKSFVDARSPEEYIGMVSGAPNERPGSLPSAVNLPYDSLMKPGEKGLLPLSQLKAKFQSAGAPLDGPQISYCHTGHRTSLVWFVSHELLGNKHARLYDGSTLEWSVTQDQPLVFPKL